MFKRTVLLALSLALAPIAANAQTGNIVRDIKRAVAPKVAVAAPAAATVSPVTSLTQLMNQLEAIQQTVVTGVIADLTAADADAGAVVAPASGSTPAVVKDPIAHACYPALEQFLQSLPVATPTTGTYVAIQLFQKQRDFMAQIQAGLPVYLKLGCAPLLGDEVQTLTKALGLIGVTVAANSILPGSSLALPVLP
jgi:hypothetical protein